eukprot:90419-Heterocapsa_arctica.AAC.1
MNVRRWLQSQELLVKEVMKELVGGSAEDVNKLKLNEDSRDDHARERSSAAVDLRTTPLSRR